MPPSLFAQEVTLQAGNRLHLLQALQGLGVEQVHIRYGGKQGRCTHCLVSTTPTDALPALQTVVVVQHRLERVFGLEQSAKPPLLTALKEFALHWADLKHPHWPRGDGGAGVMTIDVASRQFKLAHDVYLTESFCYRLVD
jgi:hypothetical protein